MTARLSSLAGLAVGTRLLVHQVFANLAPFEVRIVEWNVPRTHAKLNANGMQYWWTGADDFCFIRAGEDDRVQIFELEVLQ